MVLRVTVGAISVPAVLVIAPAALTLMLLLLLTFVLRVRPDAEALSVITSLLVRSAPGCIETDGPLMLTPPPFRLSAEAPAADVLMVSAWGVLILMVPPAETIEAVLLDGNVIASGPPATTPAPANLLALIPMFVEPAVVVTLAPAPILMEEDCILSDEPDDMVWVVPVLKSMFRPPEVNVTMPPAPGSNVWLPRKFRSKFGNALKEIFPGFAFDILPDPDTVSAAVEPMKMSGAAPSSMMDPLLIKFDDGLRAMGLSEKTSTPAST